MENERNISSIDADIIKILNKLPASEQEDLLKIFNGQALAPLYSDVIAKQIFNADVHPERLSYLFQKVADDPTIQVKSSASNEGVRTSLLQKGVIRDLTGWLTDGAISATEFQLAAQGFVFIRTEIYGANMLMLQYSVEEGQAKSTVNYNNVKSVLLAILMVHSPAPFREYDKESNRYIHRFYTMRADSGLEYESKIKTVYVQLDKCLAQFKTGKNGESQTMPPMKFKPCFP